MLIWIGRAWKQNSTKAYRKLKPKSNLRLKPNRRPKFNQKLKLHPKLKPSRKPKRNPRLKLNLKSKPKSNQKLKLNLRTKRNRKNSPAVLPKPVRISSSDKAHRNWCAFFYQRDHDFYH